MNIWGNSGDRAYLEKAEARHLVFNFKFNGSSNDWLDKALIYTKKIYGYGADVRVREYMRQIWKEQYE